MRQVLLRKLPRFYWLYMDQSAEKETESEESEQVSMVEAVVDRDVSEELQQPGSNNRLVRHLVCMGPLQNDRPFQTTLGEMTPFDEYSLDMSKNTRNSRMSHRFGRQTLYTRLPRAEGI